MSYLNRRRGQSHARMSNSGGELHIALCITSVSVCVNLANSLGIPDRNLIRGNTDDIAIPPVEIREVIVEVSLNNSIPETVEGRA